MEGWEPEDTQIQPGTDDVDKLLADIESPKGETLTEGEPAPPAPAAPEQWAAPDWARFEWNGKQVFPDSAEKAKTWLSQGYNYSQRMGDLNKQMRENDRLRQEWEAKVKRWEEVDNYARQNPQWWEHVEKGWQERNKPANVNPELESVLKPIQEKLTQYEGFLGELQKERESARIKQQDQELDAEIESIRKKHPNIDLNAVDASGKTLERRIYEHANQHGIPTFRAAFYDHLSDRLIEMSKANGREEIAKNQQAAAKKGVLGVTPAPIKNVNPAQSVRGKSYDQLKQEALAELGIT